MTTPLSKLVALLIPSPLTPKRGLGSAGNRSEVKKAVAWSCVDQSRPQTHGEELLGRPTVAAGRPRVKKPILYILVLHFPIDVRHFYFVMFCDEHLTGKM